MNLKKILITGGNGFVAQHLCPLLKEAAYEVVTTTRQACETGYPNFVTGDLAKVKNWDQILKDVDCIIHLAARVHIMNDTADNPLEEFRRANCLATQRLAEAAEKRGVRHFIFISSIHVNGNQSELQGFSEEDVSAPQTPYGISKYEAEKALEEVCQKMSLTVLRIPLVYGKGVKGNFQSLVKLCKLPIPLPFKGCRYNQRSFLFVENFCDFIKHCLQSEHPEGFYFVADDQRLSTADLIINIRHALHQKPLLFFVPFFEKMLPKSFSEKLTGNLGVSNAKAKKAFEWKPPYTTLEGLQKSFGKSIE